MHTELPSERLVIALERLQQVARTPNILARGLESTIQGLTGLLNVVLEVQVPALQAAPLAERELRRWSEADYQALEAESA